MAEGYAVKEATQKPKHRNLVDGVRECRELSVREHRELHSCHCKATCGDWRKVLDHADVLKRPDRVVFVLIDTRAAEVNSVVGYISIVPKESNGVHVGKITGFFVKEAHRTRNNNLGAQLFMAAHRALVSKVPEVAANLKVMVSELNAWVLDCCWAVGFTISGIHSKVVKSKCVFFLKLRKSTAPYVSSDLRHTFAWRLLGKAVKGSVVNLSGNAKRLRLNTGSSSSSSSSLPSGEKTIEAFDDATGYFKLVGDFVDLAPLFACGQARFNKPFHAIMDDQGAVYEAVGGALAASEVPSESGSDDSDLAAFATAPVDDE